MTRTRFAALGALALAGALALTGCSAGSNAASDGGTKSIGTPDGKGKTITVWIMNGDLSPKILDVAAQQFTKAIGAKVKLQLQQWDGITTKLTTALAQQDAPDVVDLGNTQVPVYAATGGLMDLSPYKKELQGGQTWLSGLEGPATVDGKLYGAPLFAGNRAVIYNKKTWADAGVTDVPTSYDQLTADLDKVKAKNPQADFSAFYMPGQYWYGGLQWVWDAGGQIATEKGGKWTGAIDSADAVKGLTAWKDFQNSYSAKSTQDINTDKPAESDVFAQGNASAILGSAWEIGSITTAKPELKDQIGTFPMPSATEGKTQPVFLGGSDLGIPSKSQNQELALYYTKILTSKEFQQDQVFGVDGWEPNSTQLLDAVAGDVDELHKPYFEAASTSRPTPATPGWATIEGDSSFQTMFADVATGRKSPQDAAEGFSEHLTSALNAQQ
ncbi:N,N'-diacetylchitobiose transport system substrate-binding protein [Curtobacterium luteum]|uniref:ABC transporter substrate-binding protein n=1 Tax=Curtobacterium luteum TaxID=33881 RepID=A0A8H9L281_9MICO|nr:sugar ABC transporter substrate-binding protein [Curtobacterium luteum]MBM7803836.1 N,N'-diacetylchitobiose transport system substrate-binding protein [Curtobacterium luteum]NUU51441.1 sugar ABC transporter substrate-binding protein [Curtobacterium luteum]GGL02176.1 ABC transporter substrate-binding protein [Curtobacterium luteum]